MDGMLEFKGNSENNVVLSKCLLPLKSHCISSVSYRSDPVESLRSKEQFHWPPSDCVREENDRMWKQVGRNARAKTPRVNIGSQRERTEDNASGWLDHILRHTLIVQGLVDHTTRSNILFESKKRTLRPLLEETIG